MHYYRDHSFMRSDLTNILELKKRMNTLSPEEIDYLKQKLTDKEYYLENVTPHAGRISLVFRVIKDLLWISTWELRSLEHKLDYFYGLSLLSARIQPDPQSPPGYLPLLLTIIATKQKTYLFKKSAEFSPLAKEE